MTECFCLLSNESAGGILGGTLLLGGGFGIILYKLCTIKSFVKDGVLYRNILDAPVYGTTAEQMV